MNNLVEIQYKTNGRYPKVIINGEEITRFSALSGYIYDDIFRWASIFFELVDGDLADSYRVSLTGHPYQAFVLREAAAKSEFCEGVDFNEYTDAISLEEKYAFASRLSHNTCSALTFRTSDPDFFSSFESDSLILSTVGDSPYCLVRDENEAEAISAKYCVILSDRNEIVKKRNNMFFFFVKEGMLPLILNYFLSYHLFLVQIGDVLTGIEKYTSDPQTILEFEAYAEESYRVWTEPLPSTLEQGSAVSWEYKVFPSCFPSTAITATSSDPSIIVYEGGKLVAKQQGDATISIVDANGKEFFSQPISVVHHNYATNITVILPDTSLLVGTSMHFRTVITPINAEDADQVSYKISDERIAVITGTDELYALSAGRVCMTVSTPRVSTKVYINVPAQVCDVMLSSEGALTVPFSSEVIIYGSPFPPDAFPLPDLEWSLEKRGNIIEIKSFDNEKCVIRSKEAGRAVLVCRLKGTNIEKRVDIIVPKPKACYVATAVYGSYDCPEVWALRRYRDEYLDTRPLGRLFIKCYYAISPTVIKLFGKTKFFNSFWQSVLDRKVEKLKKKGYETTPYEDKEY